MKKENLLYVIIVLLVFISGFMLGDKMNDTERYKFRDTDYGYTLYDSKQGIIYDYDFNKYTKYDLKNAIKEEYIKTK